MGKQPEHLAAHNPKMTQLTMTDQQEIPGIDARLLRRFLMAAGIFHILLTAAIFFVGRSQMMPDLFDPSGIGSFGSDSREYMGDIKHLVEILRDEGVADWLKKSPQQWHNKVISLSFVILAPLFGFTILSAELYNLVCYLVILSLIFILGREIFNQKVGMIAAIIVGLWPSFLLHTTQFLRDPLFIAGLLVLVLVITRWLNGHLRPVGALVHAGIGIIAAKMLQLIRPHWWPLIIVIVAIGIFGALCQILYKKIRLWHFATLVLVLIAVFTIQYPPSFAFHLCRSPWLGDSFVAQDRCDVDSVTLWHLLFIVTDTVAIRIGNIRASFIAGYIDAASNIDPQYKIINVRDIIGYLPRALAIGFFAPFPNMWFDEGGKLGISARTLSGGETIMMYVIEILAVSGIWHSRRQLSVWFLFSIASIGMIALALVVPNVGALYRWRYTFWMVLIPFGVSGFQQVVWPHLQKMLPLDQKVLGRFAHKWIDK